MVGGLIRFVVVRVVRIVVLEFLPQPMPTDQLVGYLVIRRGRDVEPSALSCRCLETAVVSTRTLNCQPLSVHQGIRIGSAPVTERVGQIVYLRPGVAGRTTLGNLVGVHHAAESRRPSV